MKSFRRLSIILLLIFSIISCDNGFKLVSGNNSINLRVYPYLRFELSSASTYYIASVIDGADLSSVTIPDTYYTPYGDMPIRRFKGFENKEDSKKLEVLILESGVKTVDADAILYSTNIDRIEIKGTPSVWPTLPTKILKDGYHFLYWTIDGEKISSGDAFISGKNIAKPHFEEHRVDEGTPWTIDKEYHSKACSVCGELAIKEAHTYGEWQTGKNEDGTPYEYRVCTVCGYKDTKNHVHKFVKHDKVEESCTVDGMEAYRECTICGNIYKLDSDDPTSLDALVIKKHHFFIANPERDDYKYDSESHWLICTRCGARGEEESHIWKEGKGFNYCDKCSATKSYWNGGFDIKKTEDKYPEGTLTYIKSEDSSSATVSFVNSKSSDYKPTSFEWYLNETKKQSGDSDTFTFDMPYPRTYQVRCKFENEWGSGSETITIVR